MPHDNQDPDETCPWHPLAHTYFTGSLHVPAPYPYHPHDPRLDPVEPQDEIDVMVNESLQRGKGRYW